MRLGRDFHIGDIIDDYDAIYVGIGCYKSNELGIPGEDRRRHRQRPREPLQLDSRHPGPAPEGRAGRRHRWRLHGDRLHPHSVRQGAAEVTLVYRRDLKDMPAADEAHEAIEEGARLIFQAAPVRIVTDENGKVTGVEFQRMKLGDPDEQGRRRRSRWPAPSSSSSATPCSAPSARDRTWRGSSPSRRRSGARLVVSRRGTLESEEHIFRTDVPKVFASGDVRTGAATVVEAIGEGRRASYAMDYWLRGHDLEDPAGAAHRHRAAAELPDDRPLHR